VAVIQMIGQTIKLRDPESNTSSSQSSTKLWSSSAVSSQATIHLNL